METPSSSADKSLGNSPGVGYRALGTGKGLVRWPVWGRSLVSTQCLLLGPHQPQIHCGGEGGCALKRPCLWGGAIGPAESETTLPAAGHSVSIQKKPVSMEN